MENRPKIFNFVLMFVILFSALGFTPKAADAAVFVMINEVDSDTPDTDVLEFVELYDGGVGNTALDGYVLVFYNGSNDLSYAAYDLDGYSTDANGYFLLGNAGVVPTPSIIFPSNGLQNGADAVALYQDDATSFPNETPITLTNLIDAIAYDTNDADDAGIMALLNAGQPQVNEGGGAGSAVDSNQRCPNGTGGLRNTDTYTQATPTPGAENCVLAISDPVINEFSASTTGTDVEYIEFYGDPDTDYSAYTLLEIEGDSESAVGTIDEVITLGTTGTNSLYLADLLANTFENGTLSLLLVKDFTGLLGDDLDTDNDGVLDVEPWSAVVDSVAVNDGGAGDITYGTTTLTVGYDGLPFAPGGASRIPDGADTDAVTDWVRNDFDLGGIPGYDGTLVEGEAYNTPGMPNMVYVLVVNDPVINEFSASTTGTDVEYIEFYGDPETNYINYTLLEIEGDSEAAIGTIDEVITLGTTDTNGLYLADLLANTFENGTLSFLLVKDFTGLSGDDLDTDNDGVLDVTPWSSMIDSVAVNDGGAGDITYGTTTLTVGYDGLPFAPGGASRIPDGADTDAVTDWVRNDFDLGGIPGYDGTLVEGEAYNTPGMPNMVYVEEEIPLKINEFSASTAGTDVEFVEFYGDPETDYSAYTLLEIEGDAGTAVGTIDEVIPLGTTDANGFYLVNLPANTLENGTLSLLLVQDFTGALYDDLDTNDDGVLDVEPWSDLIDSVAVNDGGAGDMTFGTTTLTVGYDGLSYAPGGASRIPDGFDTDAVTDWVRNDFDLGGIPGYTGSLVVGEAYNTPGESNIAFTPPPPECGEPYTLISAIQGSGLSTPFYGLPVTTQGIVVGDFQDTNENGFYLQDLQSAVDGDPSTSDGIFVYYTGTDVKVGDHIRISGTATEYYDLTEITDITNFWTCAIKQPLPDPGVVTLPVTSLDDFEAFEGMRVTFPQDLVIAEYFNFDRYGEIVLTTERFLTFTAEYEPDVAGFAASNEEYRLNSIRLDDGLNAQNPDPAMHPNGMEFTLSNLFRGGDLLTNFTAVVDYSYGEYEFLPTQGADYTNANPRPVSPEIIEGDVKIASLNVYNYFTTIDTGAYICGPAGDMECRGADNLEELARQRAKIVAALAGIDADIVGLMEIENDRPGVDPDYAAADLVNGLNDLMGVGTYNYIATGAIGTDAIKVALIYKTASVTPLGDFAILDTSVDARFLDTYNRPVLAQSFTVNAVNEVVTVAVNHLKSKGSDCVAVGDPDLGDGQGNCNLTRLAAAQAEVDWLASDPTGAGVNNYVIIGDLNSYDKEDPIDAIKAGTDDTPGTDDDFVDMIYEVIGEGAYSYLFDGRVGYLDYAMVNKALEPYVQDVEIWHINADEPDLIDYDTSYKADAQDAIYAPDPYRSSDHDPVILALRFNKPPLAVDDAYETAEETELIVGAVEGVLANDTDQNGDHLTAMLIDDVSNGTLVLNTDGSFSYTPNLNFYGEDHFTYYAYDGEVGSLPATVTITVTDISDVPTAMDDTYVTEIDTTLTVTAPGILENDYSFDPTDTLSVIRAQDVAHGVLTLNADGSFTYEPEVGFSGTDSFTYIIFSEERAGDLSNEATVTIMVRAYPFTLFMPIFGH